ncbi:MAG TPA: glycerophosphodiester phosphodiesterase [Rectinemataceae bacterium]|nr:glycerophosphodiester phosphodiesterase [Rectinemataceae bacterium]
MRLRKGAIVAHRGASALVEFENTLPAFEKAIELGADAMEFDVRRCADGILVSFHDDSVAGKRIAELSFEELQAIAGERGFAVPMVEEIFELARGRIFLDIELKESGYEKELVDMTRAFLEPEGFVVTSFIDKTISTIKRLDPHIETGLLLGVERPRAGILGRVVELFPGFRLRRSGADFVAPHYLLLRFGFLARMRRRGYPVYVWTVNDPGQMARLIAAGVHAIITDRPDIGLELTGSETSAG